MEKPQNRAGEVGAILCFHFLSFNKDNDTIKQYFMEECLTT